MKMQEMNKQILKENLKFVVEELQRKKEICSNKYKFIINPVFEENKNLNGSDEFMRLTVFTEENIGGKLIDIDDVIDVLGGLIPLVPIWINVSFIEMELEDNDIAIFQLDCSMRFRKPSLLQNAETGHPPFGIIE